MYVNYINKTIKQKEKGQESYIDEMFSMKDLEGV